MGKRLITQRRGRGTHTYKSPSHKFKGKLTHRKYDDDERKGVIYGKVSDLIHCPGHTAPLAVVKYDNKEEVLISAPEKIKVNDIIASGSEAPVQVGNTLPLKNIPEGTLVYNIECRPGDGGRLVRTAGAFARIIANNKESIVIKLPSKKQKKFLPNCRATIGTVAGSGKKDKPILKAGKKRLMMKAKNKLWPKTSGVAMNAVDHPFGSGRGRHAGKPKTAPRNAPAGRNVGLIKARQTGRRKGRRRI